MNKFHFLKPLKLIYILTVVCFLLPWFSFFPEVMGYRFGYIFLPWFAIPMSILGICTFGRLNRKRRLVLGELSIIANLILLVVAVGKWMEICNISSGWDLARGVNGALPTYWISVAIFVIYSIIFQYAFIKNSIK